MNRVVVVFILRKFRILDEEGHVDSSQNLKKLYGRNINHGAKLLNNIKRLLISYRKVHP